MNVRHWVFVLLALPSFPCAALAQSASADRQDNEIDQIVVTASRLETDLSSIAAAASIIDGNTVQQARQQLSLDESMSRVPGLFFQNRYNAAQDLRISIRGFGSRSNFGVRGIAILVDGVPETLADGQTQVDSIDLGFVERIEVLRGPSSAQFGNAAGGVISITSEIGADTPFVEARLVAGADDYSKLQLKTAGSSDRLDYAASLSQLDYDGYRAHSLAENTQLNARLSYRPSDAATLGVVFSHTDQPESDDAGGLTRAEAQADPRQARARNVDFDAGEALDQQKIGISYRHELAGGANWNAKTYYLQRDFANKLPFASGGAVDLERRFSGLGADYRRPLAIGGRDNQLVIGFDVSRQDDERKRFDNNMGMLGDLVFDQNELVRSSSVFIEDALIVTDATRLSVGLRYDRIEFEVTDRFLADGDDGGSRTLDAFSPTLGVVTDLSSATNLYATMSTSFQTPTSTEFANPDGSGGFNPALEPQLATNYEVGIRSLLPRDQRIELAVYRIDVEDELIPYEIAANPGRDYYANAGRSTRNGIELSYSAAPTSTLNILLSYTYSDFRFDEFVDDNGNDFAGNRLPGIPRHFVFAELAYQHPSGAYAAVDAQYVDALFANNANTETIDAYAMSNLRAGFNLTFGALQVDPFVGIHNLFDEAYTANVRINAFGGRFFEPGPGRNAHAGVSLRYEFD